MDKRVYLALLKCAHHHIVGVAMTLTSEEATTAQKRLTAWSKNCRCNLCGSGLTTTLEATEFYTVEQARPSLAMRAAIEKISHSAAVN